MGETELDRAIARIKELERENRALWYACGMFRQAAGSMTSLVIECSISGKAAESDGKDAESLMAAGDKVLGGIVPLAVAN